MILKDLLAYFEEYYGEKYSGVFFDAMVGYLEGYSGSFYQAVAKVMVKRFSRVYNKAPDIAEIEKHMREIMDTMELPGLLPETAYQEPTDEDKVKWQELCERFFKGGLHEN